MVYPRQLVPYLIFIFTYIYWAKGTGTTLPPFRQLANELQSGKIEIVNATVIRITNFYYDGKCPDAHFWVGKGVPSPDGTLVPNENGSREPLSRYNGKNLTISLPDNLTISDVDYLAIWCTTHNRNLGHIFMHERYVQTKHGTLLLPLKLQPFNTTTVTADSVIIKDEVDIAISNLRYNQTGNNTHFRVGSGAPSSSGKIVPNEYGSSSNLGGYNGENITLHLPENVTLTAINYLTVWDNDNQAQLGTVYLNRPLPQEQDIETTGFQLDKFSNETYKLRSGPILLINEKTFYITNLHHNHDMTDFRVILKNGSTVQIPDETGNYTHLRAYQGDSFYLTLPKDISVREIEKFGIWHASNTYLSYVTLNSSITLPSYRPYPDVTDDGRRIIRVQKCCPLNYVVTDSGCTKADGVIFDVEMKLHLANDTHLNDEPMTREWIVFAPYINNIDCPKYFLTPEMDNYSLLTTEKLLYISAKEQLSLDKYCMDTISLSPEEGSTEGRYINTALVCAEGDSGPRTMHIVFAICAFLSAISLFLTAAIYFVIRREDDKRGFSIAGYAGSMGVAFVCLAITQIAGLEYVCKILGSLFHFFIVTSFVWFVIITYEAFYHVKYFDQDSILMGYLQRRKIYICLSLAVPTLFLVLTFILDLPAGLLNTHLDAVCLFDKQKWMLYTPIIICIVLAIGFAGFSAYLLNQNDNISRDDGNRRFIWNHQKREVRMRVWFCLFLVSLTTVCWLSEIITFSLRSPIFIFDVIHALQGVMVLTTVLSTGGVFMKIVTFVRGTETPTICAVNGRNALELTRLNSDNYQ